VTSVALRRFWSLSRGVRCEMQFSSPKTACAWCRAISYERSPCPNSGVTQELAAPAAAILARRPNWRLATRVVTFRRVEWAIDSLAPHKSPGVDGIYPALLQQAREVVIPYLV